MSAELIREAAAKMRARAEAATPGPWHVCGDSPVDADSCVVNANHDPVASQMDEWYETDPDEPTAVHDAAHIASWHPAVALAVADWLDACALVCEVSPSATKAHAIAVARAYLGGTRESPREEGA